MTPLGAAVLAEVSSVTVRTHTAHVGSLGDTGAVTVATLDGTQQRVWKNRVLLAVGVRRGGNLWSVVLTEPPSRSRVWVWT